MTRSAQCLNGRFAGAIALLACLAPLRLSVNPHKKATPLQTSADSCHVVLPPMHPEVALMMPRVQAVRLCCLVSAISHHPSASSLKRFARGCGGTTCRRAAGEGRLGSSHPSHDAYPLTIDREAVLRHVPVSAQGERAAAPRAVGRVGWLTIGDRRVALSVGNQFLDEESEGGAVRA